MNALEIIEQVRAHDADVVLENNQLIVRGRGKRLPEELQTALREQKAAVMVALGAPADAAVASVLAELRPFLLPALQRLPDSQLLVLVNFAIFHAFNKAVRSFKP
jgi:hypothetical protein